MRLLLLLHRGILFLRVGDQFLDGGRQRSDLGHIRGNDQLGGFAVGDLREGFEGFKLDDLLAGSPADDQ